MTLEERIAKIEDRNRSVERNKAWETSWSRKILLIIFTYLAIALYLKFVVGINLWINAIVPAVGFLLSTLSLPWFKSLWASIFIKDEILKQVQDDENESLLQILQKFFIIDIWQRRESYQNP